MYYHSDSKYKERLRINSISKRLLYVGTERYDITIITATPSGRSRHDSDQNNEILGAINVLDDIRAKRKRLPATSAVPVG